MAICRTYINGYFFEYDCEDPQANIPKPVDGIQYRIVTDLENEPVTIEEFKQHARIDFDTDDNLITDYLKSARQELEQYSQLSFGNKTIKLLALRLPTNYRLMYGPVASITSPTGLTLFGDIVKDGNGEDVTIEYTTSWTGQGGLPLPIKIAICQYAAGLYMNRENILSGVSASTMLDQAKRTLDKYKNIFVI
jgi:hypothetical protein